MLILCDRMQIGLIDGLQRMTLTAHNFQMAENENKNK